MREEDTSQASKRQVPAVTRAIAILRFLARSNDPVGVNPIARELDLVPSTCLHILRVLQDEGLVEFDLRTKRYSIGVGILPLARSALQKNTFSVMIQPRLSELSARFSVTAIATQLSEPGQMVVVALSQSPLPFRLQVDLGSRFPLLISATGRLFAAFGGMGREALQREFSKLVWDHPPSFADWLNEIDEARARGFAVDHGTYISGVTVVAVPVFNTRKQMIRSLVAIGITERLEDGDILKLAGALTDARNEIENMQITAGS